MLDLPTPKELKAELILVFDYITRLFACPQMVTHTGSNHSIATQPEVEHTTTE